MSNMLTARPVVSAVKVLTYTVNNDDQIKYQSGLYVRRIHVTHCMATFTRFFFKQWCAFVDQQPLTDQNSLNIIQ